MIDQTSTDGKEYERIFNATRIKLFDNERRIIRKLVWSLYEDYGLSPRILHSAFQSVILDIEALESRYEKRRG